MVVEMRTRVSQVTPESPGIPRAVVYGLCRTLPGDRAFLSPSPLRSLLPKNLTQRRGVRTTRFCRPQLNALVFGAACVHRILSRVRDDLEPPLCGTGRWWI